MTIVIFTIKKIVLVPFMQFLINERKGEHGIESALGLYYNKM